jgi:hypothetical protein
MAEMELGYGSEYQLLRFLGRHREELERIISQQTRINAECDLQWRDYPKDVEHKGINFLPLTLQEKNRRKLEGILAANGNPA